MSKYSRELRYIYENEINTAPPISELSLLKILDTYPLENENFIDSTRKDGKNRRQVLNEKIISHYYFSEIGFENDTRFLFALKRKLNEIMPLYNQRYKSIDLDVNPIDNVNMTETFTHSVSGNGSINTDNTDTNTGTVKNEGVGTSNSNTDSLNVGSDTPPTELSENDILSNKFASNTSHDKNSSVNASSSTNTQTLNTQNKIIGDVKTKDDKTETYERKEFGSSKGYTFAQNIQQWRDIMLNIDLEIVDSLKDLFINLW